MFAGIKKKYNFYLLSNNHEYISLFQPIIDKNECLVFTSLSDDCFKKLTYDFCIYYEIPILLIDLNSIDSVDLEKLSIFQQEYVPAGYICFSIDENILSSIIPSLFVKIIQPPFDMTVITQLGGNGTKTNNYQFIV
jgi:hypothetical protein